MDDKLCLLAISSSAEDGTKELVTVEDGYRKSYESWYELLNDLKSRSLKDGPKLVVGDGALGLAMLFLSSTPRLYTGAAGSIRPQTF